MLSERRGFTLLNAFYASGESERPLPRYKYVSSVYISMKGPSLVWLVSGLGFHLPNFTWKKFLA